MSPTSNWSRQGPNQTREHPFCSLTALWFPWISVAWQPFRLIGHPLPLRPIFCCSAPHLNLEITGAMTPLL